MGVIESLGKRRADKNEDCKQWTALEMLEDLINEIKAGRIKPEQMIIHYIQWAADGENDRRPVGYYAAGVTYPEHITLLEIAKQRVIRSYMNWDE